MANYQSWKDTFNQVMKRHNGYTANGGKVVSYATRKQRSDVLLQGFRTLREMGYKFNTVKALRGKHIERLMQHWEEQGCSASTLQNRLSIFRTFASWIGKKGMILGGEHYISSESSLKRSYAACEPRTWSSKGIDSLEKIMSLRASHERFGDALLLQKYFGLRTKESLLLKPEIADKGAVLVVMHGTKGGRSRFVPIETQEQRVLLERIKGYLGRGESLVPRDKTYAQYRNQYYYALKQHGICRKGEGITAHGLRHEHLNDLYRKTTGHSSAVEGGILAKKDKALDSFGRQVVSERAGHERESISASYLGSK